MLSWGFRHDPPPFGSRVAVIDIVSARLAGKGPGRGPWRKCGGRRGIEWGHHGNKYNIYNQLAVMECNFHSNGLNHPEMGNGNITN